MPADETGAPTDETPNARSSSSVPPKDITLGSSEQGSNVSSATGLSPVGQASMATDLNTSGVSVPTTTRPTAQETKVAATVTAKTGTKGASAATDVHAPVSKGAPKAPNAPSALDMSFRADVTSTDVPSAHGRSRKKGRRSSSKSSSSSGSSKTSRQGATEGERKVKDAPSRDKTSLEKGAFDGRDATGSTAATTSAPMPSKAPSVSGLLPSVAHPVAGSKATLQEAAADVGLPSDQRTPGKTIGGVFTGNYDDSISKITSTKVKGTKATKAFAEAGGKTASVSARDQLQASLRSESAPVPETALASDREVGTAAPSDGKASKFAVVAETPANEAAGSLQLRGNVTSTTTGSLSSSEDEKPASATAGAIESASAAGLGGHQAPEAPLREKVSDGDGCCCVGWLSAYSIEGRLELRRPFPRTRHFPRPSRKGGRRAGVGPATGCITGTARNIAACVGWSGAGEHIRLDKATAKREQDDGRNRSQRCSRWFHARGFEKHHRFTGPVVVVLP
ncbi:hypothetical protein HPB50_015970 [Hyalomma asiaticum]|uniref:Uncharacterized protein n=1 Tax=Hyalomma asiaticum TaxID=266040 RepID=A0ACB7RMY8_HYAAI|nr:hypothetical protein HPB50_015970 [Hyalomma asiaticum]